jgi:hypothetical protein
MRWQMTTQRIWVISAVFGVVWAVLPILLIEATPNATDQQGFIERLLSFVAGPGVLVARSLFGIHSPGFFIAAPLLNWSVWTGITYLGIAGFNRLSRSTH